MLELSIFVRSSSKTNDVVKTKFLFIDILYWDREHFRNRTKNYGGNVFKNLNPFFRFRSNFEQFVFKAFGNQQYKNQLPEIIERKWQRWIVKKKSWEIHITNFLLWNLKNIRFFPCIEFNYINRYLLVDPNHACLTNMIFWLYLDAIIDHESKQHLSLESNFPRWLPGNIIWRISHTKRDR